MLPERPQDKARLVLLDGQRAPAIRVNPWQPRATWLAVGGVLVEEEALLDQRLLAEREELARHVLMSRAVEGVGDQGAVARPGVGICVACELRDVEVGRRDDGAAVVGMRACGEQAPPVELGYVLAELLVDMPVVLLRPHLPEGEGPAAIGLRPAADDELLAISRYVAEPSSHAQPVDHRAWLARRGRSDVETDGAVDRALLDRVSAERSVFCIDPRAGQAIALLAVGPCVDPELGPADAPGEEVTVGLVRDDPAMAGLEKHRVADVRTFDVPVVMEEDVTCGKARCRFDLEVADEPVAGQIDIVLELDGDPESRMRHRDVADQRVLGVAEMAFPGRVVHPGELAIDEKTCAAYVAHRVVGVTDPREENVANRVVGVEADEDVAISDD